MTQSKGLKEPLEVTSITATLLVTGLAASATCATRIELCTTNTEMDYIMIYITVRVKTSLCGASRVKETTHAAVFLLVLAGLSLSGTAVAFIATMPLFVVFSPVLVPAGITTGLLAMGLAASGGSGLTALSIISWLYK
ncbi:unnamed protein product, partial [Brassica napus]